MRYYNIKKFLSLIANYFKRVRFAQILSSRWLWWRFRMEAGVVRAPVVGCAGLSVMQCMGLRGVQ